jgi:hypothetical protein
MAEAGCTRDRAMAAGDAGPEAAASTAYYDACEPAIQQGTGWF